VASDEEVCPEISVLYTGLAIRDYLLAVGEGSPYHFYKCFKRIKPTTSYKSVVYYFYLLRRAGLIELVRTEPSSRRGFDVSIYRIVPGKEAAIEWLHPQQVFYPQTKLGAKRYKRLMGK